MAEEIKYNLGNVVALIRSDFPPTEEDGVTEKRYILWAQPQEAPNESYVIKYYDGFLDEWLPLVSLQQGRFEALLDILFGGNFIPDVSTVNADFGFNSIYELLKAANLPQKVAPYPISAYESVTNADSTKVQLPFERIWDSGQNKFFAKKAGQYYSDWEGSEYYKDVFQNTKYGILYTMDKGNGITFIRLIFE